MRYYLIAGEASGDLHASNLMAAILKEDAGAVFRYMGGDRMEAVGGCLVRHYRQMAFMGLLPVIANLGSVLRNMRLAYRDIAAFRPDAVIPVDYPGFNLRVAKHVKRRLGTPVFYYISPKIWAWKRYRIRNIRRYTDRMLCILPFEEAFYAGLNYKVDYVGNPTVDCVSSFLGAAHDAGSLPPSPPVIALLAGSRKQEIADNLPVMIGAAGAFAGYRLVVAGAPGVEREFYDRFTAGRGVEVVYDKTYALLRASYAALVTSGTATLETALFRVPQVVCYRTPLPRLSGYIFRHFFSTPFISLVNLIGGRAIVKEMYADRFSQGAVRKELDMILNDQSYRGKMMEGYSEVAAALGKEGAPLRAARLIVSALTGRGGRDEGKETK
ncbi:MAG: lipid-A-disaccharide synthase [Tannerellaceae bacterium]|jgi:lipid-A-disaccharide synthase|nr:lipid-A-disaccharide synthase [Tannerellaceae bacterium]